MNGAESLVRSLLNCGVNTCFANPGTSEMHFVAALDRVPGMRCVPSLFEGVATGAADGYGRMLDKPAATLLHLGPGLANGLANLHNARRAGTPVVNIVGEHASWHLTADAPLHTDIAALAGPMSRWVHTVGGQPPARAGRGRCRACQYGQGRLGRYTDCPGRRGLATRRRRRQAGTAHLRAGAGLGHRCCRAGAARPRPQHAHGGWTCASCARPGGRRTHFRAHGGPAGLSDFQRPHRTRKRPCSSGADALSAVARNGIHARRRAADTGRRARTCSVLWLSGRPQQPGPPRMPGH